LASGEYFNLIKQFINPDDEQGGEVLLAPNPCDEPELLDRPIATLCRRK